MKFFALIALFAIVGCVYALQCQTACDLDDEFEDNPDITAWETFMNELESFTFNNRSFSCFSDDTTIVSIDGQSDIIWDLRFRLYSQLTGDRGPHIDDCFCQFPDCASLELKQCLVAARKAMTDEIVALNMEVSQVLLEEALQC